MVWRRVAIAGVAVAALMLAIVMGSYVWLDSQSGRNFVARQIAAFEMENGLNIRIGKINGSIYGDAVLSDVRFRDPKGEFARAPEIRLDWNPLSYFSRGIAINALTAKELKLSRLPAFHIVPDRGDPLLPDLDINIERLQVDRIVFAKAITGEAQVAALSGKVKIADRRAIMEAAAGSMRGDRIVLKLDAVPDDNRFDVDLKLDAPAKGLVAGLLGREVPMKASLTGRGSWRKWDGALTAQLASEDVADLALTAREGTFTIKGTAAPAKVLADSLLMRALSPVAMLDMATSFDNRVAKITGSIRSAAVAVDADGVVDLGKGSFDDLALDFRILRPSIIGSNVSGANIRGRALLNGAIVGPMVAYSASAGRLAFDATAFEDVTVTGEMQAKADRFIIPVNATARRVTGVNQIAGGLLTNVRVNGDIAIADGRVLSDNLKIRSDRINAKALLVGDIDKGVYTTALDGKVDGFQVNSVGLFNVVADVDVETTRGRGYALVGTVKARSTRLFSQGFQNFLGGQMFFNAGIRYGTNGILQITRATLVSPLFRLNSGSGTYVTQGGGVVFNGQGYSNQYGPVRVGMTGTFDRPEYRITATNPGFGIGMSNVVGIVTASPRGYAIAMTGSTDYGPISGDVDVLSGKGPLTMDILRGNFAGIGVTGRIRQAASGPFVGTLKGAGSGFDGTIALSAQGKFQRVGIDAVAINASLSGERKLAIGRGIINADIILYNNPQVIADVQVENAVVNDISIAAARAKLDYRAGAGAAQILAEGRRQVPFRLAANADFTPQLWRIAAKGRANGVNFATDNPARIVPRRNGYDILPSNINVADGNLRIAGSYGDALVLQSRFDKVDIAVLDPLLPGLGLGGRVSGSLDWSQASLAAFPNADARLEISRFARTYLGSRSQPVDISLVARLLPTGGNARFIIRRRGAAVGRMQVDLTPLPPGNARWTERLLAAPLSGGIRYNGPADTLFSLAGLADQSLTGNIGVAADFSGRVQTPILTGVVRANDLVYENDSYGTRLTDLRVRGVFTNDQLEVTELSAKAGDGTVTGKGIVNLSAAKGFPVQLNLDLDRARVARSELISTTATGRISVTNTPDGAALISGTLRLPETRFKIIRQGAAKVATLTGVRRKAPTGRARVSGDADAISSLPSNWKLDIRLEAPDELYVSGMGLESEWGASLRITGTSDAPLISGDMGLVRGTLGFAGRSFELESGRISFNGGPASNPSIRVTAASSVDGTTVRVNIAGTGQNPAISFSSTPALPQDEIMARILFGNSIAELSAIQAVQLAGSLNSLRGGSGGLNPLGVLQSATGLDRLRLLNADANSGRETAVAFGQYITNDVYVEIVTDARGYTATQLEISLTRALSVLSQIGTGGTSNVNIRYKKDY
ncbi:translocation/assembly module TamB domain-containing protein [Sphingorhabdus sp.]|jgi:translocation and assembly module TamB|uniref:translocation/assembly module TamB domain-containing protein n=2 Tax=Sphingorhabdus sp. TaxID=1902408 RepID=UPI0037C85A97